MAAKDVVDDVKSKMVPGKSEYLVIIYCHKKTKVVLEDDRSANVITYDLVGPVVDQYLELHIANELDRRGVNYNIRRVVGQFIDESIHICVDLADWRRCKGF